MSTISQIVKATSYDYAHNNGDARVLDLLVSLKHTSNSLAEIFDMIIQEYNKQDLHYTITSLLSFCLRYVNCLEHFLIMFDIIEMNLDLLTVDQKILSNIFYKLLELLFHDDQILKIYGPQKVKGQTGIIQKTLDNILLLWQDLTSRSKFQVLIQKLLSSEHKFYKRASLEMVETNIYTSLASIKCIPAADARLHIIKDSLAIRIKYSKEEYELDHVSIKIVLLHKFKNRKQYKSFKKIYTNQNKKQVKSARK